MTLRASERRPKSRTSLKQHAPAARTATFSTDAEVTLAPGPSAYAPDKIKAKPRASASNPAKFRSEEDPAVASSAPTARQNNEDGEQGATAKAAKDQKPSEAKALVGQEESKVEQLEHRLLRRNEELAAIALYLKETEEKQSSLQRAYDDTSKALSESNAELLRLQLNMTRLKENQDRERVSRALATHKKLSSLQFSTIDQRLLFDPSRTHVAEDEIRRIALDSRLFDSQWYMTRYSLPEMDDLTALEHYLESGHRLGLNPSPLFDGQYYVAHNPDIDDGVINPLRHYIQFGVCERRQTATVQESSTVRIIMMQRNEVDLLYPWVLYHGLRFGFENLHIIDNGSDDSFRPRLEFLESIGVHISFEYSAREDFINKGSVIADIIRRYDKEDPADFYFPLDCDEFIGVASTEGVPSFSKAAILAELRSHLNANEALIVSTYYDNHPVVSGIFKKTPGQRKAFFAQGTCEGLDRGFSNPKVTGGLGRKRTSIIYAHYHFKPFPLVKLHARQKLEAFLEDFSVETLRQYVKEKKTGFHSARHLLTGEREYQKRDLSLFAQLDSFCKAFEELGLPLPFSDYSV
jgi:chemotaxis protein histidine kinase CheA